MHLLINRHILLNFNIFDWLVMMQIWSKLTGYWNTRWSCNHVGFYLAHGSSDIMGLLLFFLLGTFDLKTGAQYHCCNRWVKLFLLFFFLYFWCYKNGASLLCSGLQFTPPPVCPRGCCTGEFAKTCAKTECQKDHRSEGTTAGTHRWEKWSLVLETGQQIHLILHLWEKKGDFTDWNSSSDLKTWCVLV